MKLFCFFTELWSVRYLLYNNSYYKLLETIKILCINNHLATNKACTRFIYWVDDFKFINCIISSKLRSLIFIMIKVNKLVCDFSATLSQFWIYIWSVQSRKVPICSFKFFCFETKKIYFALSNRACANLDLDSQRKYFSRQKNVSVTGAAKHRWKFCFSTGQ
jgi:hypothetical protein